jgi:hypothetical protein
MFSPTEWRLFAPRYVLKCAGTLAILCGNYHPACAEIDASQAPSEVIGQYDASSVPSFTKFGANNGPDAIGLRQPAGIALDGAGHRLFVSDSLNNRILVFNLNNDNSFPDYEADYVLGQEDFNQPTSRAGVLGVSFPGEILFDSAGQRLLYRSHYQAA